DEVVAPVERRAAERPARPWQHVAARLERRVRLAGAPRLDLEHVVEVVALRAASRIVVETAEDPHAALVMRDAELRAGAAELHGKRFPSAAAEIVAPDVVVGTSDLAVVRETAERESRRIGIAPPAVLERRVALRRDHERAERLACRGQRIDRADLERAKRDLKRVREEVLGLEIMLSEAVVAAGDEERRAVEEDPLPALRFTREGEREARHRWRAALRAEAKRLRDAKVSAASGAAHSQEIARRRGDEPMKEARKHERASFDPGVLLQIEPEHLPVHAAHEERIARADRRDAEPGPEA